MEQPVSDSRRNWGALAALLLFAGLFVFSDLVSPGCQAEARKRRRAAERADPDERVWHLVNDAYKESFLQTPLETKLDGLDLHPALLGLMSQAAWERAREELESEIARQRVAGDFDRRNYEEALHLCIPLWRRYQATAVDRLVALSQRKDAEDLHERLVHACGESAWSLEEIEKELRR